MSLICFGTSKLDGNKSWLIPFGLFFVIPAIVAACIWFIPEVGYHLCHVVDFIY